MKEAIGTVLLVLLVLFLWEPEYFGKAAGEIVDAFNQAQRESQP